MHRVRNTVSDNSPNLNNPPHQPPSEPASESRCHDDIISSRAFDNKQCEMISLFVLIVSVCLMLVVDTLDVRLSSHAASEFELKPMRIRWRATLA
jgi:hypothetical protein